MKQKTTQAKVKKQLLFSLIFSLSSFFIVNAQTTEAFEDETNDTKSFTEGGVNFLIEDGPGETTYDIEFFASGGWNGTAADNRFIDNSNGAPLTNDGSSFTIKTADGSNITVKSLYLFLSTRALAQPTTTLTITGKKDGATVYTISKNSGFSNVGTLTPNNGFTFIDFSTEGGSDNSNKNVDEIFFQSTGNADYLALDAFIFGPENTLKTEDFVLKNNLSVYPNPSNGTISISNNSGKSLEKVSVFDMNGRLIYDNKLDSSLKEQSIKLNGLNTGLYLLKVQTPDTYAVKQIVIE